MSEITAQYAAGLFDGEGCVAVYMNGRKTSYSLQTMLRQNVNDAVSEVFASLRDKFGGSLMAHPTPSGKRSYNWQLSGQNAANFLEFMLPHLRFKLEQARIALAWYRNKPKPARDARGRAVSFPPEVFDTARLVSETLRKMKAEY
jgi:hypothetical protein